MATKTLPIFCIMFLFFTSSLLVPSSEAVRSLQEESKAQTISRGALDPNKPLTKPRGKPYYSRPCNKAYGCSPPGA